MILVIGYGNPGRGDDGLGPEFARRLGERVTTGVSIVTDFQLKVEHAVRIATATQVVFVDASVGAAEPYEFIRLAPADRGNVSSHDLSPAAVLALAELHFGAQCPAYVLGICGVDFDYFHEGLSAAAESNLRQAEGFFDAWLGGLSGDSEH